MFKLSLAIILPIMWVAPPFEQTLITHAQDYCVQYLRILLSSFGEDFLMFDFVNRNQIFCIFPNSKFCQNACRWSFTII